MEIIRIIVTGLIIFLSSWLAIYTVYRLRINNCDKNLKILKPPFLIFWIGLILFLMCIVMVLIIFFLMFNEENLAYAIGIFLVSFLSVWLILYALNWKIIVHEESFIFSNIFRKKREIRYSEITKLKRLKSGYRIYVGKKSIAVDYFVKGADNLWDILKVIKIDNKQQ